MEIGIRNLKEHLSEYLDRAAEGETIIVTDRGQAKAMLVPIPIRTHLEAGIAEGWVRAGNDDRPVQSRRFAGTTNSTIELDDDREDR